MGGLDSMNEKSNEPRLGWLVMGSGPNARLICSCDACWYWRDDGIVYACARLGAEPCSAVGSEKWADADIRPCDMLGDMAADTRLVL